MSDLPIVTRDSLLQAKVEEYRANPLTTLPLDGAAILSLLRQVIFNLRGKGSGEYSRPGDPFYGLTIRLYDASLGEAPADRTYQLGPNTLDLPTNTRVPLAVALTRGLGAHYAEKSGLNQTEMKDLWSAVAGTSVAATFAGWFAWFFGPDGVKGWTDSSTRVSDLVDTAGTAFLIPAIYPVWRYLTTVRHDPPVIDKNAYGNAWRIAWWNAQVGRAEQYEYPGLFNDNPTNKPVPIYAMGVQTPFTESSIDTVFQDLSSAQSLVGYTLFAEDGRILQTVSGYKYDSARGWVLQGKSPSGTVSEQPLAPFLYQVRSQLNRPVSAGRLSLAERGCLAGGFYSPQSALPGYSSSIAYLQALPNDSVTWLSRSEYSLDPLWGAGGTGGSTGRYLYIAGNRYSPGTDDYLTSTSLYRLGHAETDPVLRMETSLARVVQNQGMLPLTGQRIALVGGTTSSGNQRGPYQSIDLIVDNRVRAGVSALATSSVYVAGTATATDPVFVGTLFDGTLSDSVNRLLTNLLTAVTTGVSLGQKRSHLGMAFNGETVYALGGRSMAGTALTQVDSLNAAADTLVQTSQLLTATSSNCVLAVAGTVYSVGGAAGDGAITGIQKVDRLTGTASMCAFSLDRGLTELSGGTLASLTIAW